MHEQHRAVDRQSRLQPRLRPADRTHPAEVHGKTLVRLEAQVEVPFTLPVAVQALDVLGSDAALVVREGKQRAEPAGDGKEPAPLGRCVELEERAVQPKRAQLRAARTFVRVEGADQAAGRVPREQHRRIDRTECPVEVGEVLVDVLAEAGMLVRAQRAAMLAAVERVEGVALGGEALGHVALEKIVDETVHVEHRAARRRPCRQAHQGGDHFAVVVVGEALLEGFEALEQAIGPPVAQASSLTKASRSLGLKPA